MWIVFLNETVPRSDYMSTVCTIIKCNQNYYQTYISIKCRLPIIKPAQKWLPFPSLISLDLVLIDTNQENSCGSASFPFKILLALEFTRPQFPILIFIKFSLIFVSQTQFNNDNFIEYTISVYQCLSNLLDYLLG